MKIIFDYNRTLFDPDSDALFPGVLDMLKRLARNNELLLVSKDTPGRENRLDQLGIRALFSRVCFVDRKTLDLFKELIGDSKDTVVVGDRAQGELYLGSQLGCTTVWIRQGKFSQELPLKGYEPTITITSISELEKALSKFWHMHGTHAGVVSACASCRR